MEKKKQFSLLKVIVVTILVLALCAIFYSYFGDLFEEDKKEILNCSNLPNLTFEQIYEDKVANETVAKDKYLNNSYNFSGTIDSINYNEYTKQTYIKVQNVYVVATVYFNKNQEDVIKTYKKGDSISFCGTVDDISPIIGAMDINNSIIVK